MSNGVYDRRGSSIAADVDAAIERIVDQFESGDLALRLDVLRALSSQAKLAFETTRMREHLTKHPVSTDIIQGSTMQSQLYNMLAENLTVESYSCNYDVQRNVVMTTDVRWTLQPQSHIRNVKKRKKMTTLEATKKTAMLTMYRFERTRKEKEDEEDEWETSISFTVTVAFEANCTTPRELLNFEMTCEHAYPRSYYEDQQQSYNEGTDADRTEEMQHHHQQTKEEQNDIITGQTERNRRDFGENCRSFRFDDEVLADICNWMGPDDDELDLMEVIGFFMALPVYEDEWVIDERICEILFQGEMGVCTDEESCSSRDDEIGLDGE
ncbi:uncharacterized protein PHALS_13913 [Plasmopara halstedii]|uniref:Uncharacterized protein n=1 Tax=Plasmopara halstedii TaxID=4781 RepID=A0A0P1A505_PLAHL|nr:uncharacterized protein PHALS_13913 [Plasmopara halstedii]CEG35160.1 hypothetical protein PHALS_13913 [Plasmopara halstedii]|eukprot:XP_024571529.1 hypothetical protein PHALS_13913 [Plasmopara halstedii]